MSTTCTAIIECIAANLGRGLEFVDGQIRVRISQDADNATGIGTDGGVFTPAEGIGPGEQVWRWTLATLPEQAMASTGGGNLVGASTQPQLMEYAIAHGIEIYSTTATAGSDGAAIEVLTTSMNQSVTTYTDNPGPLTWADTASLTFLGMKYDAGTRVNPTGRNSGAPAPLLTPDGGWGGFYLNQYPARPVAAMLRQVWGRNVVFLNLPRLGLTEEQIGQSIVSVTRAVVEAGAQEWCVVLPPGRLADDTMAPLDEWVPLITAEGVVAGVNLGQTPEATDPWPVAALIAAGVTWVSVSGGAGRAADVDDARVIELVGAGLNVNVVTDSRQYWTDHYFGLGVRAVQAFDPVYARGGRGEPGDLDYRMAHLPGLETRTPDTGAITPDNATRSAVWQGGFARLDLPGRWFPAQYGWPPGTNLANNHQLLGTISPIPNADNYIIQWRAYLDPSSTPVNQQETGLFFASPTDRNISVPWEADTPDHVNGYLVSLLVSPTLGLNLFRYTDGVLDFLDSDNSVNWLPGEWHEFTVTVQGSMVSGSVTNSQGTATVADTDSTHRGPYAMIVWNDRNAPMVHGYNNPSEMVMYEPLP